MKKQKSLWLTVIVSTLLLVACKSEAVTYLINPNSDIVGNISSITVLSGESLEDLGRRYDIGVYELMEANPRIDPTESLFGDTIIIPSQFILPSGPRKGITINLAEMRIYYFHKDGKHVSTYPIGIGRKDWETPLGKGTITEKRKDPSWRPPASVRAWYDEHEMYLPDVVPPGPLNPLGKYALRLSIPGYLIHGTNAPKGIGIRSSAGCIRLYPEDIEDLFQKVSVGDPVRIIHAPYKIGRHYNQVFIETHEPLSGDMYHRKTDHEVFNQAVEDALLKGASFRSEAAKRASKNPLGYPILIQ